MSFGIFIIYRFGFLTDWGGGGGGGGGGGVVYDDLPFPRANCPVPGVDIYHEA